jgi:hypothetical protein
MKNKIRLFTLAIALLIAGTATAEKLDKENTEEGIRTTQQQNRPERGIDNHRGRKANGKDREHDGDIRGRYHKKMREDHEKFAAWLEKNYPDKAQRLAELKDKNDDQFSTTAMWIARKYKPIYNAEMQGNTELVAVLKEGIALRTKVWELTTKIENTTDENDKQALVAQLKDTLNAKFDNIIEKRNLQYVELQKKLVKLQKELKEMEENTTKIKANKDKEVQNKLDKLLGQSNEFGWN